MPIRPTDPEDPFSVAYRAAHRRAWPDWREMYDSGSGGPQFWVRFHDLPRSKRYPDSDAEDRTVVSRKRAIISAVAAGDPDTLWVTTVGYGARRRTPAHPHPAIRRAMREPVWIGSTAIENGDESTWVSLFAADDDGLDAIILAVSDDFGRVVLYPRSFTWMIRLYDGGCDIYVSTQERRDELTERFSEWLAPEYLDRTMFE